MACSGPRAAFFRGSTWISFISSGRLHPAGNWPFVADNGFFSRFQSFSSCFRSFSFRFRFSRSASSCLSGGIRRRAGRWRADDAESGMNGARSFVMG